MRLTLVGHSEKYLCEGLALLFFPGVRFRDGEDGFEAVIEWDGAEARTTLFDHGREESASARDDDCEVAIGKSFLAAGEALTGYRPEWGSLTGIRPARIAKKLLSEGLTGAEVQERMARDYRTSSAKSALALEAARRERAAEELCGRDPVSLYLSIPFCPSRCAYCSFVSQSVEKCAPLMEPYVEALLSELSAMVEVIEELSLSLTTVYIGGGTPTALPPHLLERLLSGLADRVDLRSVREFTVEAGRPDTVTAEKLALIKAAGAGRISINPQTLQDRVLQTIGRRHTVDDFRRAMETAASFGFDSINCDLIAGLPGETAEEFRRGLLEVLSYDPANVTVHTLSVKRAANLRPQGDELLHERAGIAEMVDGAYRTLCDAGFHPYYLYRQKNTLGNFENVGYAKADKDGLYNIYIMGELHTIAAVGAGATTKFVDAKNGYIERAYNKKYPKEYLDGAGDWTSAAKLRELYRKSRES